MNIKRWFVIPIILTIILSACNGDQPKAQEGEVSPNIAKIIEEPTYILWNCEDAVVSSGEEIALYYEWITKTEEQSDDYFDVTKHLVSINGIPTSIKGEGLEEVEDPDGYFRRKYWMNIGELEPGTYEIVSVAEITEQNYDGWDWYGPDSDYDSFEAYCTITISDQDLQTAEGEAPPTYDVPDLPTPSTDFCNIYAPFKEEWNTFVCETFDNSTFLWTGSDQGTTAMVDSGRYVLDNSTRVESGYTSGFIYPIDVATAEDYMISVDGFIDSNFRNCTWGVFVRSTEQEVVYFFMIDNQGVYTLTGSSDEEAKRYLGNIKDGQHNSIIWDEWNNITAIVDGTNMEFYINGEYITSHEAINASNSNLGLIVWGGEGVTAVTYFDNLIVRSK